MHHIIDMDLLCLRSLTPSQDLGSQALWGHDLWSCLCGGFRHSVGFRARVVLDSVAFRPGDLEEVDGCTFDKLKKNHELSDREECQEFQLLVVQLLRFQFVDEDECDRFSSDSEPQKLDNRARRFLRMLVLFVVGIVDHEELFYILVESFSHVRRAFFCILVLLEQNQVVDLVVVEHRLH